MDSELMLFFIFVFLLIIYAILAIIGHYKIKKDPELQKKYDDYMRTIYPNWPNIILPENQQWEFQFSAGSFFF